MFEAKQVGEPAELQGSWFVREIVGDRARYLCKDGEVRCGASGRASRESEILADPRSAYYPTQAAALEAIAMHYASDERHDDPTDIIDDGEIRATLGEEGE